LRQKDHKPSMAGNKVAEDFIGRNERERLLLAVSE
jgi:hypothetical protein